MAVSVVRSAKSTIGSAVTSKTLSFDATGCDFVVGYLFDQNGSGLSAFSATYNSVAMTSAGTRITSTTAAGTCAFYLASPASGTNTFSVSWTGSGTVYLAMIGYTGALGTISGYQSAASGSTTTSTTTVTTGAVGDMCTSGSTNRLPEAPTFTGTIEQSVATQPGWGAGETAGAASVVNTWTISSSDIMTSLAFNIIAAQSATGNFFMVLR